MNAEEATNEQILQEVEDQAAGETPKFDWSLEWMKRVGAGTADHTLLEPALHRGGARLWPNLIKKFDEGNLFGSQHLDFASMLMLSQKEVDADFQLWETVKAAARGAVAGASDKFFEISDFYITRISMDYKSRRRFVDEKGQLKALANFSKDLQDYLAKQRENYVTAGERYGWWWASPFVAEREEMKTRYAKRKEGA